VKAERMLAMQAAVPRLLRVYLGGLGILLLLTGIAGLLLGTHSEPIIPRKPGFLTDSVHQGIHVVWGLAMLFPLVRRATDAALAALAVVFGIFYVLFGLLGVLIHQPFGLHLGWDENGFHLLAGPVALILGAWTLALRRAHLPTLHRA
jgi:hypothetical protein